MRNEIKHWDKESFLAYVLIHAAHADFVITKDEEEVILRFVSETTYGKMYSEYKNDNDFQSVEKIIDAKDYLNLCEKDCDSLLDEIEEVFKADGKYDILEKNMYLGIKKILSMSK